MIKKIFGTSLSKIPVIISVAIFATTVILAGTAETQIKRPEEGSRTLPGLTLSGLGGNENLLPQYMNTESRKLTEKMTENFSATVYQKPSPHRLSIDRSSGKTPKELLAVLDKDFADQKWQSAYNSLIYLLKSDYTVREKSRVYYYMGQCSYFQGEWQRAYLEFLLAEKSYSRESGYWKNIILDKH